MIDHQQRVEPETRSVIATIDGIATLACIHYDVLLRLDQGVGRLPVSRRWLTAAHDATKPLMVIDFQNRGHPFLRRAYQGRKNAYLAAGWQS
jgi:hypothetical protein